MRSKGIYGSAGAKPKQQKPTKQIKVIVPRPPVKKQTDGPPAKKRKREVSQFVDEAGVVQKQQLWTLNVVKNEADDPVDISSEEDLVLLEPPTPQVKTEYDEGAGPSRPDTSRPPHDQEPSQSDASYAASVLGQAHPVKQEAQQYDENEEKPPWIPPEYYKQQQPFKFKTTVKAKDEFARLISENPWPSDNEKLDETREMAPKAGITKVKGSKHQARPCWLRLRRKWLARNFLQHLIGDSNIRYKRTTYCSICHHPSTAWDCHPLCWQCYIEMGLPLCGLNTEIECPYCEIMGSKARRARADKLRHGRDLAKAGKWDELRQYSQKTGLPNNIYTQQDADAWDRAKKLIDMPNPDWLIPGQPVGSCFPECLIPRGQSIADAIAENPGWKTKNYSHTVNQHNSSPRDIEPDPDTPSDLRTVYVPRCLLWGIKTTSERDEQLKQVTKEAKKVADNIESQTEVQDPLKASTDLISALAKRLIPLLEKPQTEEAAAFQGLMDFVANDQVAEAAQEVTGVAEGGVAVTPNTIKDLSNDQLQAMVRNLSGKLQEQQETTKKVEQQLTEAQKTRRLRDELYSPSEQRQNLPAPIVVHYQEKGMQVQDWQTKDYPIMNAGLVQRVPQKSTITELLDKMQSLKLDVDWTEHADVDENGEPVVHYVPKLEPRFLAQHWKVLADLQDSNPFNLRVGFPEDVGLIHGVEPHFKFEEMYFNPDQDGMFPTSHESLLLRYAEAEQLTRLTAAIGAFNNIVAVATRLLSMRIEDLGNPMEEDREAERILASTIREASDQVNKLTVRANALSEGVVRRDAMLRGGLDPTTHAAAFASPFLRDLNYAPFMGS